MVGTAPLRVTFSSLIRCGERVGLEVGAGEDEVGAGEDRSVGEAPGVGVEHGDHRHDAVVGADADRVGHALPQGVQDVGAVRVEDALGVAGGAARVAEAGGLAVVEVGEVVAGVLCVEQLLVAVRVGEVAGVAVADDDVVLDGLEGGGELLEDGDERVLDQDHLVLGVVDDVGELLGEEAHVEGVEDGAHAGHGHVDLEVLADVPGEGGDAVALLDAQLVERGRELLDPLDDLAVAHAGLGVALDADDRAVLA